MGYPQTPGLHTDEQAAGWKAVVDAIHHKGAVAFSQLWHVGRISHSSHHPDGSLPVSASAVRPAGEAFAAGFKRVAYEVPRALETNEIPAIIDEYDRAAQRASAAGFDGVELHAANGYLIDQFLQDGTNHRTDRYGGSIENRTRLLLEVADRLIGRLGAAHVGVRLSPFGSVNDVRDSDPFTLNRHAIEALSARGIAYLHLIEPRVQAGFREEPNLNVPASVISCSGSFSKGRSSRPAALPGRLPRLLFTRDQRTRSLSAAPSSPIPTCLIGWLLAPRSIRTIARPSMAAGRRDMSTTRRCSRSTRLSENVTLARPGGAALARHATSLNNGDADFG
jgi:NADH:flavin oxidoreductase / NADH oxidase family